LAPTACVKPTVNSLRSSSCASYEMRSMQLCALSTCALVTREGAAKQHGLAIADRYLGSYECSVRLHRQWYEAPCFPPLFFMQCTRFLCEGIVWCLD
jgi:hypothetical protein